MAGGGAVLLAVGLGIVLAGGDKKAPPPPPPPLVKAKPKPAEPPPPPKPTRVPPKPLTTEERAFIDGLFQRAQPHIDAFRKYAKEGWDLKGKEDNEGANDVWLKAKHEYQAAVQIVSEALEDEDRFPGERPGMDSYNSKLGVWTKEHSQLPKVYVK